MKLFLLVATTCWLSFTSPVDNKIIGTWQAPVRGATGAIRFKDDKTFNVFINKKLFTSGTYTFSNDTLTYVSDVGCLDENGASLKGVYKINFFATDSLQFQPLQDSCTPRQHDLNLLKMGKIKS